VDTKSGEFFKNARRSGLWPDATAIHRSSLTKARKKVSWKIFRELLQKAVKLAYELWPKKSEFLWHDMSVFATDGSKFNLPATEEIREKFDPESGLEYSGKGHFPQCLVSTLFDVFRRLPIARTVVSISHASEREEAKNLLPFVPSTSVWLFDRGYPSYDLILYLINNFSGYFIFRCPSSSTFSAITKFIKSDKNEEILWITPSNYFLNKHPNIQKENCKAFKLRAIRLLSPDGTESVLLTNLYNSNEFPRLEIVDLYFRRWEIEGYYRDEKIVMEIEKFHSKTVNGILQELFAVMIMTVISRTLMALSSEIVYSGIKELQFKHTVITLASEAAILTPLNPKKAIEIFNEVIEEISRVIYYRPKILRPSQPRHTKKSIKKWCHGRLRYA